MKKLLSTLLFCMLISIFPSTVFAESNDLTVKINQIPQSFPSDSMPYISDEGRTMVPVRFISERFGAKVKWNAGVVEILEEQVKRVILKVGEKWSIINVFGGTDMKKELDATVVLKGDRTFVPLRFVSESLDAEVTWDAASKTVGITSDKVKRDTSRIYDRLNSTGEYELVWEDKNLGWAKVVPKDKKAKYEMERRRASLNPDGEGYIQMNDISIRLISYDLYTRHKVRELLQQIFPTQSSKAYDYLILALREEIWQLPQDLSVFPGINYIYLDNRGFSVVNNTNDCTTNICVGMDGYFGQLPDPTFDYTTYRGKQDSPLKERDYELYKEYQLDQY